MAEIHAEPPPVDLVHAESPRECVERARPEQGRGTAAQAIRRGPRSPATSPRLRPAKSDIASLHGPSTTPTSTGLTPELGAQRAVEPDFLRDRRAIGNVECQRARVALVARHDLLEGAGAPSPLDEPVVLVDEKELSISRVLLALARGWHVLQLLDGEALDRTVQKNQATCRLTPQS